MTLNVRTCCLVLLSPGGGGGKPSIFKKLSSLVGLPPADLAELAAVSGETLGGPEGGDAAAGGGEGGAMEGDAAGGAPPSPPSLPCCFVMCHYRASVCQS